MRKMAQAGQGADPERAVRIFKESADHVAAQAVGLRIRMDGSCLQSCLCVPRRQAGQAVAGADPQDLVMCQQQGTDTVIGQAIRCRQRGGVAMVEIAEPIRCSHP